MHACLQQKYLYAMRSPSSRQLKTRPQGSCGVGRESLSETGVSKASIHSSTTAQQMLSAHCQRNDSMQLVPACGYADCGEACDAYRTAAFSKPWTCRGRESDRPQQLCSVQDMQYTP